MVGVLVVRRIAMSSVWNFVCSTFSFILSPSHLQILVWNSGFQSIWLFVCISSILCYPVFAQRCINPTAWTFWKNTAHKPDDNIQLCFCINDSKTLSKCTEMKSQCVWEALLWVMSFPAAGKRFIQGKPGVGDGVQNRPLQFCFRPYSSVYLFQTPEKTFLTLQKMRYIIQQILNPIVYLFLLIHFQNSSIVYGDYQSLSRFS